MEEGRIETRNILPFSKVYTKSLKRNTNRFYNHRLHYILDANRVLQNSFQFLMNKIGHERKKGSWTVTEWFFCSATWQEFAISIFLHQTSASREFCASCVSIEIAFLIFVLCFSTSECNFALSSSKLFLIILTFFTQYDSGTSPFTNFSHHRKCSFTLTQQDQR